jgi:DNA repair protein NreA
MESLCMRCRGKGWCGKRCKILDRFIDKSPKVKEHFSGSTPPEVFVGRVNYPNVFCGILSPNIGGETSEMSLPEEWVGKDFSIEKILDHRAMMVYARNQTNLKLQKNMGKLLQELALASKSVSTEFFLQKKPVQTFSASKLFSIMANPAPLKKAIIEENIPVPKKVDYLVSDYDAKSISAVKELYDSNIQISHIQKLFSTGLLGIKKNRKMVPTRWSITAVDDIVGKEILEEIKHFDVLEEFLVFEEYYNGNKFEVLFLPGYFEFEVMEVGFSGSLWSGDKISFVQDYESFFGRKEYAKNVVGAYYADRLSTTEYLLKIKKQAKIIVFHEEREEYYAPLGVGIIREAIRRAMKNKPVIYQELNLALEKIKLGLKLDFEMYLEKSIILKNYGKQKSLNEFF